MVLESDNIQVQASMAGYNPDNIDVSVENDVLTIKATFRTEREHNEGNYLLKEFRTGASHR